MIRPPTSRVDETASDTGDEELVVDEELDDAVQLFLPRHKEGVEFLGLWDGAGEAVEDESARVR